MGLVWFTFVFCALSISQIEVGSARLETNVVAFQRKTKEKQKKKKKKKKKMKNKNKKSKKNKKKGAQQTKSIKLKNAVHRYRTTLICF